MKIYNAKNVAAAVFVTAISTGVATAMEIGDGTKQLTSINGVSSVDISVTVKDGVATLFGSVDAGMESVLVANYVSEMNGVDKVVNLISVN